MNYGLSIATKIALSLARLLAVFMILALTFIDVVLFMSAGTSIWKLLILQTTVGIVAVMWAVDIYRDITEWLDKRKGFI